MKQFSGFRSKSYGVSLKDRGAILPAGHSANGAYWFSSSKGKWVSSDYYKEQETEWLTKFNSQNLEEEYLENGWSLSLPKKEYNKSASDENNYELSLSDRSGSVFPYDLKSVRKEIGWGVLKRVPQGNQMTADLAKLIIKEEELGKGEVSDFISISFSATDYVGHRFGVQSVEVQDTYIKLDSTLADLLQFLDEQVGSKNYLLFLTADHGASYPRNYLKEKKLPAGEINAEKMLEELQKEVNELSGRKGWLITSTNLNFYFNRELKSKYPEEYEKVKRFSKLWLQEYKGVAEVLDTENSICAEKGILKKAIMGVHPQRSGELIVIPKPNWNTYFDKGSTHGSAYTYDTHVPLLFYGAGVENGSTATHYPITSIVPTLSQISGIPFQSSGEATVINELVKQ